MDAERAAGLERILEARRRRAADGAPAGADSVPARSDRITASGHRSRVLSIQSHVVYGCVGNKAAVFPLMLRGFDVDPLNTCQLSNHLGYGKVAGSRTSVDDVREICSVLESIGIGAAHDHILTGFIGRADVLRAIAEAVDTAKSKRGDAVTVLCDPVCGDNGKLYVPEDVPPLYKELLLRRCDIATPNGFEAGYLSGIVPTDVASARKAAAWFHDECGVKLVVITSFEAPDDEGRIHVVASLRRASDAEPVVAHCIVPKVDGRFSGTGDMFSALVLSEWGALRESGDLAAHLTGWCATLWAVLELSRRSPRVVRDAQINELDIVGAQCVIANGARCDDIKASLL